MTSVEARIPAFWRFPSVRGPFFALFVLVTCLLWAAITFALYVAQNRELDNANSEGRNLAQNLAERLASSVRTIDQSAIYLSSEWSRDSAGFGARVVRQQAFVKRELVAYIAVIGADGQSAYSNLRDWQPADFSNYEYFKFHQQHGADQMYIGAPVLDRDSTQWTIPFTRPIYDAEKRFAGVVVFSVTPAALERVYDNIQRDPETRISLLRSDGQPLVSGVKFAGVVSASVSATARTGLKAGDPIAGTFREVDPVDKIDGLYSYRKVAGYPLTVYVQQPVDAVLAPYYMQRRSYLAFGVLITALLFAMTLQMISKQRVKESAELNRARLAAIVESSNDAIIGRDLEGKIVSWNAAAERLYGYTASEMLGMNTVFAAPELSPEVSQRLEASGGHVPVTNHETVHAAKNGRRFAVSISISPIRSIGGEIIGISAISRDITERRLAEEKLQAQVKRAEALLEAAPDAVVIVDKDGLIVVLNAQAEKFFGYARAELLGQPVEMLIPQRLQAAHLAQRVPYQAQDPKSRAMGTGRELLARHKDGSEFAVAVSLRPMVLPEGTLVISTVRDLTERRRADRTTLQNKA